MPSRTNPQLNWQHKKCSIPNPHRPCNSLTSASLVSAFPPKSAGCYYPHGVDSVIASRHLPNYAGSKVIYDGNSHGGQAQIVQIHLVWDRSWLAQFANFSRFTASFSSYATLSSTGQPSHMRFAFASSSMRPLFCAIVRLEWWSMPYLLSYCIGILRCTLSMYFQLIAPVLRAIWRYSVTPILRVDIRQFPAPKLSQTGSGGFWLWKGEISVLNDLFETQPDQESNPVIGNIVPQTHTSTSGCSSGMTLSVR